MLLRRAFELERVSNPLQNVSDGELAIAYPAGEGDFADRAKHPLPGLVVLDLKMPKVNGLQVLQWVRSHRRLRALPVAFLTATFMPQEVALAYYLGVNTFIVKPFSYDELREIVRFLKGWVRHATPPPSDERDWLALTIEGLEERWPHMKSRAA
jgi:DNA-binding response OmpR family regulator